MLHQIGLKLRGQIRDFSRKLCSSMGKVAGRFVEEMVYGIQARGSVRLSEIARSLEEKTSMKKRINRLSRNLGREGLCNQISAGVLADGAGLDIILANTLDAEITQTFELVGKINS